MSTPTQEIDAVASVANWTRRLGGMYANDLKALSDEAFTTSAGAKARTAQDFTSEVMDMNAYVQGLLTGEGWNEPTPEEKEAKVKSLTREAAMGAIVASCNALADAMEANRHKMAETTKATWGEEMSLFAFSNLAANHIMYHDGQVTFIQSLHGDAEMHWFDQ